LPQSVISEQTTQIPETIAKQGIPGQIKEKQNYDKNTICVPRQDYGIPDRMNWNGDRMGTYLTLIMF